MKTLILLIGPKGSGKTHIGSVVEKELEIPFLRVEPLWLALKSGEDGWKVVEREIDRLFETSDWLVIESLGAGEGFNGMRRALASKYELKYVRVLTDLEECLRRVQTRDSALHIQVSDDRVAVYNEIAAKVELPWTSVIDNNGPATAEKIVEVFQKIREA